MPVDPELLGHLMDETAAVNAAAAEWRDTFGFAHNCHCDRDYATENMLTVTECWAQMVDDALETCVILKGALGRIASGEISNPEVFAQEYTA